MKGMLVYPVGTTRACGFAAKFLTKAGFSTVDHPTPEVTHLLLDVPSFGADGSLRGGGDLPQLLRMLPPVITVIGGNLDHRALDGYVKVDLLKDEEYLAVNAAITADCALRVAAEKMNTTFSDTPTLVIGWGRIGKCLAQMLRTLGADVTIAARKETDRAMIRALGYRAVDLNGMVRILPKCRLVYNTVPQMVLHIENRRDCIFIDLASVPGIDAADVIWARGLPGVHAPESSGKLIADTLLRLTKGDLV